MSDKPASSPSDLHSAIDELLSRIHKARETLDADGHSGGDDDRDLNLIELQALRVQEAAKSQAVPDDERAREWSKNIPRKGDWYVSGWYFQRRLSNHALQIVEINQHGFLWRIGGSNHKFVRDLFATEDYEWLGPITPDALLAARPDDVSLNAAYQSGVEEGKAQMLEQAIVIAKHEEINDRYPSVAFEAARDDQRTK